MNQKFPLIFLPITIILGTALLYGSAQFSKTSPTVPANRVKVEFFVMSKCPDASLCETLFLPTLMKLNSLVNFTVSFIGSEPKYNDFQCMHGQSECIGNKQQLCVQNMYHPIIFMKYLQCQAKDIHNIPYNGEYCAKTTSPSVIRWSHVQTCVLSNKANDLLRQSLEQTRRASAKKSCSIYINGMFWCMHDGYWSNCFEGHDEYSLAKAICLRYKGKVKPTQCSDVV